MWKAAGTQAAFPLRREGYVKPCEKRSPPVESVRGPSRKLPLPPSLGLNPHWPLGSSFIWVHWVCDRRGSSPTPDTHFFSSGASQCPWGKWPFTGLPAEGKELQPDQGQEPHLRVSARNVMSQESETSSHNLSKMPLDWITGCGGPYRGILVIERKGVPTPALRVWKHYTKWKKPGTKDWKLNDPIYTTDPLQKEMATLSSIPAWEIPWTEEPGELPFMGLQRVGHDWGDSMHLYEATKTVKLTEAG